MSDSTQLTNTSEPTYSCRWIYFALVAVILLTSAIRIRLLQVPFERDEGEYAYAGQLMLQGVPPYEKAYNMKMPGIYAAYALLLAIFGQTHTGIHFGLVLISAGTAILVFLLAKELFNPLAGVAAGAAYALLSVGQTTQGFTANAEHFVALPALAGILLLRKAVNSAKLLSLFLAGFLLGLAFMMKQHAAAFIIFAAIYLFVSLIRPRPVNWKFLLFAETIFTVGVLLLFLLTCLILWWCGVFSKFWFWTFDYAKNYVSLVPLEGGLINFKMAVSSILPAASCLWTLAGIGLCYMFRNSTFRKQSLFVTAFLIFSFLSMCPGLFFRPHYWILFLPAVSLLAGVGAASVYEIFSRYNSVFVAKIIPVVLFVLVFFHTLYQQWNFFFTLSPTVIARNAYGSNPFPESLEIAKFIKQNSQKNDTVAVIGSEPQIYFYSHRLSATGYVYTYPLMEPQPYASSMQEEMINQIEKASPKFLVLVHIPLSWLPREKSDMKIFEWSDKYAAKFYHTVGIVDIVSADQTTYRWGTAVANYKPQSQSWLLILRHNRYGDTNNILPPNTGATGLVK